MKRFFKQFIYGVFYLAVLGLVLAAVYSAVVKFRADSVNDKLDQKSLIPEIPRAVLTVEDLGTEIVEDSVRVIGTLKNETPIIAREVIIKAAIFDGEGFELFVSQTLEEEIGAFESKSFIVFFPKDENLREQVDLGETKVYVDF